MGGVLPVVPNRGSSARGHADVLVRVPGDASFVGKVQLRFIHTVPFKGTRWHIVRWQDASATINGTNRVALRRNRGRVCIGLGGV